MAMTDDATTIMVTEPRDIHPLTASAIKAQVQLIQEVMGAVMQEDQHYGVIPGTNKPTLYKPGAEKLAMTFRLAPSFHITKSDLGNSHREYEIRCILTHIPSGQIFGEGVGSCSTMESNYRYRRGEPEDTGKPVPREYWNVRKTDEAQAQKLLGGKGLLAKKNADGQWHIMKRSEERTENLDLADVWNTVLKMAKKRAQVDAILTATAASDCFTQDLEDFQLEREERKSEQPTPPLKVIARNGEGEKQTTPAEPSPTIEAKKIDSDIVSQKQIQFFIMTCNENGVTADQAKTYLRETFNIDSRKGIPREKFEEVLTWVRAQKPQATKADSDADGYPLGDEPGSQG